MKKLLVCWIAVIVVIAPTYSKAQDPITLVVQQGIKKVIVAIDLKIQRLQTKTIWLQNAQKALENTMAKAKIDEITIWVKKQKDLYQDYFDELWKVKDVLSYYQRIKEITELQMALVNEYKRTWKRIRQDDHFTFDEVTYMSNVYTGIIEESIKNLDQVVLVMHSFTTRMSDAKRMELINEAANVMQQNYNDLKAFNIQNILLSLRRSKDTHDITTVKQLYGLN